MNVPSAARETKDEFERKLGDLQVKGFAALGVAMGVATGLLDKLARFEEPHTCHDIADKCNVKNRYVKEWLGIMVCADIVDFDATSETFFLPHHRRPYFTQGCREEDSSLMIRCLPMLASSFDEVRKCFDLDGPKGIPYNLFNYHPEMSRVRFEHNLIDEIKTFPELNKQLETGGRVLDVACGSGLSTRIMAKQYPNSHFIGLDIASDVIAEATTAATNLHFSNVEFICASATDMPSDWTGMFDFLFLYNGIHDAFHPHKMLQESMRVLKPGALAMIHEPSCKSNLADAAQQPNSVCIYTFSLFRCLPLSLNTDGALGLGAAWGKQKCERMLEETGFNIQSAELGIGESTWRFLCTKPRE